MENITYNREGMNLKRYEVENEENVLCVLAYSSGSARVRASHVLTGNILEADNMQASLVVETEEKE